MGATTEWSGPAGKVTAYGGIKTPKLYTLVVSDIDDLIADAFKMYPLGTQVFSWALILPLSKPSPGTTTTRNS
jgi:hypothetical protein